MSYLRPPASINYRPSTISRCPGAFATCLSGRKLFSGSILTFRCLLVFCDIFLMVCDHGIALTVLLRQLSHAHFSEIALDCLLEERFALLIFRRCVGN